MKKFINRCQTYFKWVDTEQGVAAWLNAVILMLICLISIVVALMGLVTMIVNHPLVMVIIPIASIIFLIMTFLKVTKDE